jgi:hypothetical protein
MSETMEPQISESTMDLLQSHSARSIRKQALTLFADRSGQRWIVLDSEGRFWELPEGDQPWEHRQPVYPTEEMDLDRVPGHYKQLLGLPF